MIRRTPPWGVELLAPLPLAAMVLLGLNDHYLKAKLHNALTGKLSDVALGFLLPLLLSALLGVAWRAQPRARLAVSGVVGAGAFAALEMWDAAGRAFGALMAFVGGPLGIHGAVLTRDPTDLLALLLIPVAYLYGVRRFERPAHGRPWGTAAALALGTGLLVATSPPLKCDEYTAPAAFRLEGDCAPPGLIVVDGDKYNGYLKVSGVLGGMGQYTDDHCPFQYARGGWSFDSPRGQCAAALEGEELWITCRGDAGAAACRAKLTLQP